MPNAIENKKRKAALFRNGRSQAVRIPKSLELGCTEVLLYREGGRLVMEPIHPHGQLLAQLKKLKPIKDVFPDVDTNLPELDDVAL